LVPGPQFSDINSGHSPIVFSPDGERICVSGRTDGTVQLHGFDDGELTAGPVISGSSEDREDVPVAPLRQARFAPDGRLAIADGKRRMWFYDVSGDEPRVLFRLDRQAEACRFSSDGSTLVTHEDVMEPSPTFDVWTLGPDGATFRFSNHPVPPGSVALPLDNIDSFAVSPDGRLAMTGHLNGALRFGI
jgi:WD40 repeat protein